MPPCKLNREQVCCRVAMARRRGEAVRRSWSGQGRHGLQSSFGKKLEGGGSWGGSDSLNFSMERRRDGSGDEVRNEWWAGLDMG